MVDLAASVWRDFVTDGVPSSGANKPVKAKIREWGAYVEGQQAGSGLVFVFSATTSDADPGLGVFRFNNATTNSATAMYIDNVDGFGTTVSAIIDSWDDSTNPVRGTLNIRGINDETVLHVYRVTGSIVDGTGYRKVTVSHVGGSGAFVAADQYLLTFSRAGDPGAVLSVAAGSGLSVDSSTPSVPVVSANYTGNLQLSTTSLQSPLPTKAAVFVNGTTTTTDQNFLVQYELISNTISNLAGGAVALDYHVEATANSGSVWASAGTVQLDTAFPFATYSAFAHEAGINNLAGEYSDISTSASLGISLNGLGYRNSAAIYVNNMQQTIVATSATAAGNAVLTFAGGVPLWFKAGGVVTNLTHGTVIPAGTTMLSKTATTITLSANVTGAGVAISDVIQIAQPLWYQGIKFAQYGVSTYSINDQSNSATVLNVGGAHALGIDFSGATITGAAMRMGVGVSQGITARFSGIDYLMMYADASGHAVFGNSTLGNMFADSNWVPQVASTYNLGTTSARWASINAVNGDFSGTIGVGITPSATTRLTLGGTIANGAGNALGLNVTPTLAPASGSSGVFMQSGGTVATGGNTIASAYAAYLAAPLKSGGGTITTAYSLFLENPTSATTNYSLYSSGQARFATTVTIDGTGSSLLLASTAAINFGAGNYTITHLAGALTFSGSLTVVGGIGGGGYILSTSATAGVGYATGAGGTVTQITSRVTGVTLNKVSGAITMFSAAGSATAATFTVTNSAVAVTDTVILNQKSGTNLYNFIVTAVAAGSFNVTFYTTGGVSVDAPVINFNVIKGIAA